MNIWSYVILGKCQSIEISPTVITSPTCMITILSIWFLTVLLEEESFVCPRSILISVQYLSNLPILVKLDGCQGQIHCRWMLLHSKFCHIVVHSKWRSFCVLDSCGRHRFERYAIQPVNINGISGQHTATNACTKSSSFLCCSNMDWAAILID